MLKKILHKAALKAFPLFERIGLHVVPAHYYYPVPSAQDLPDDFFDRRSACVGIDWRRPAQEAMLRDVFARYRDEVPFPPNGGLASVDAAVLHAMVRHFKPKKIIEIGSGHSTTITARACLLNARDGAPCEFVAIEPYPAAYLRAGVEGLSRLIVSKVQDVDPAEFSDCDLLFVDSSHVVSMGGDVTHIQLEIVPRVSPGCLVHFHDILLPGHYWKDWVRTSRFFWTEQYLLQALLMFNTEFQVVWAARYMQLENNAAIAGVFPFHRGDHSSQRISSFWIQRRRESVD